MSKSVLITGTSSAFGKLIAKIVDIDVTDEASVQRGIESARAAAGGLDVLVNNAGVGVLGPSHRMTGRSSSTSMSSQFSGSLELSCQR
jgi:NAD(P)-dependent dehydrogenase (short-subunit alcohol dehydrogenase family)